MAATISLPAAAQDLLPPGAPVEAFSGVSALLAKLSICSTVEGCGFHWYFLALLFGSRGLEFENAELRYAWDGLFHNFSIRVRRARSRSLRAMAAGRAMAEIVKERPLASVMSVPATGVAVDSDSSLVVAGHNAAYFEELHVAPFLRHLRCYAAHSGMRFVLDTAGTHVQHATLGVLADHYWTARNVPRDNVGTEATLRALVSDLLAGRIARAAEVAQHEDTIGINIDDPAKFAKVWALARHLQESSLTIYFDVDVTIRPDSLRWGIAKLILQEPTVGAEPYHIFVRDSWWGTEGVNSGFVALRNTRITRLFLELWQAKLWWPASHDQGALAETILEIVGMEASELSMGARGYDSQCLPLLFPVANSIVPWQMYCDCWQGTLADLIGPYRQRRSHIVGFVDPERVDLNFVPNNLFHDHAFDLGGMRLVPRGPERPALDPLVVHWAGLSVHRVWIMEGYLSKRFNVSAAGCPQRPVRRGQTPRFGSRARAMRCCEKLRTHSDRRAWPWTEPVPEAHIAMWGCFDWRPVSPEECIELLGSGWLRR